MYDRIRPLTKDIADKIAAGEVVERPFSVVKELFENSVDAGASKITVEIRKGGKEYIRVSDDGSGILRDDISLAFQRHATSKIYTDDDLNSINSLGFRGEALASIASVANVEMLSKKASVDTGGKIVIRGGEIVQQGAAGASDGTTVVVTDLFYNIPARKKFLKSDNSESALITDYVSKMAIANPQIAIRMINNGVVLFATRGSGDLKNAIMTVFGPELVQKALPVSICNDEDLGLRGLISSPSESKANRRYQVFFVNGRLVKSRVIEKALDEAYSDRLFDGRYPAAFLFLDIPAALVDVNIHPSKTEIRFIDEVSVFDFLAAALRKSLMNPDSANVINNPSARQISSFKMQEQGAPQPETSLPEKYQLKEESIFGKDESESFFEKLREEKLHQEEIEICESSESGLLQTDGREFSFSHLSYVTQFFSTYLIARDELNVYFIDQHAAHERIMFEELMNRFEMQDPSSQLLLAPLIINLPAGDKERVLDLVPQLCKLGYVIDDFGPCELAVKEVPSCMDYGEAERFLHNIIEDDRNDLRYFDLKKSEIISNSCKAAIKAGDAITRDGAEELFRRLDKCANPYSCPHGRPTFIRYNQYDLERLFKRK